MPGETFVSTNTSPLLPSPSLSTQTTLTFSSSSVPSTEKWFVDINNNNKKNFDFEKRNNYTVYDLRGQEHLTHVDTTGFQAFSSPSVVSPSLLLSGDDEEIKRVYYPEVEQLIKERTGT